MHDQLFNLLKTEHQKVKQIMEQINQTPLRQKDERELYFYQLKQAIIPHMKGEEQHLYMELERNKESHMQSLVAEEEHRAARQMMNLLDDMAADEERWAARFQVFQHMINDHIKVEETEIFELARRILSEDQVSMILENYKATEEKVLARV